MNPEQFLSDYEHALGTQDWANVEPLIHTDACVTFSNGTRHEGREAVEAAFRHNFTMIKSEDYRVSNVNWVQQTDQFAVGVFDYAWKGIINGQPAEGEGRGTHVLVKEEEHWKLLAEHLGPRA